MTPERYKEVGQLYRAALEVEPERRAAFLVGACGNDEALRQEVESLLGFATRSGGLIDQPALEVAAKAIADDPPWFPVGQSLGHYRILSLLGKGGMGEVYCARDTKLDRTVALKLLPAELAANQDRMRRFVREAKAASALNHPHVATIYEIGAADGVSFIAMEYVEGQTLVAAINGRPLDAAKIIEIGAQVADALDEAHSKGITHRDIKPANLMLTPRGRVKVLDFGLAKVAHPAGQDELSQFHTQSQTTPGVVMGTVAYMSPEQALGREVDHRSDIFSLGVALYEMATGQRPFRGATASETIDHILHSEPEPLAQFNERLPAGLAEIVSKCLAKSVVDRYASAQVLLADLKTLQTRLLVEAEHARAVSSEDEQTLMLKPTTTAAPEAKATAVENAPPTTPDKPNVQKWWLAALLSLGVLGGGFFGYRSFTATKSIKSIAVMPFVNESGNQDVEYLSDGMAETLIKSLSNLPNLNVKPRSSVFRYKGKNTDLQTIAKELSVQAILTGRVVQRGNELTLSLELVDVSKDRVIWSEQYNQKQSDLVSLQSKVAKDISTKLKSKLSGEDTAKVEKKYTEDPEAYQLYLKGRYQWNKRTGESLKLAVGFFNQAIEKDPSYALAYSGLAESYVLFPIYSVALPLDSMPKAKAAALRAIELDDSLAETRVALGIYYSNFAWNQPAAEKEFRRAIELNPNYAPAHHQFGVECLTAMGRFDEAVAEGKRAAELDPLSPIIGADLGLILIRARRFEEALAQVNRVLTLDPNFWVTYWYLGMAYHGKGQYAEAVAAYRKALAFDDNPLVKALLIRSLARSGKRDEAVKLLGELRSESARRYVPGGSLAVAYGSLGEKDKAFAFLDKEFNERASRPKFPFYFIWDDLRDDPRFGDWVRRVELAKLD